ncbi:MAG: hypothetical protein ACR2IF_17695 [Terriglobales bacterium]
MHPETLLAQLRKERSCLRRAIRALRQLQELRHERITHDPKFSAPLARRAGKSRKAAVIPFVVRPRG